MNTPSLSICIPTFNRADVLEACLASIVPQCAERNIEICISDNASEDQTPAVVKSWQTRYARIKFNRNPENRRIDRNIVAVAALAESEYLWFLSDDDTLEPSAIEDVLTMIGRYPEVPILIVNRREFDESLQVPAGPSKPLTPLANSTGESVVSLEAGLVQLAEYLGYLPAWVIRREAWSLVDPTPFLDTDFVHVGVGLAGGARWSKARRSQNSMVISNKEIIRCRLGRASWRNRHYEIWIRNWHTTMLRLAGDIEKSAYLDAISLVVRRNYLSIVSGRAFGGYSMSDYRVYVRPFVVSTLAKLTAVLVAVLPRGFAKEFTRSQRSLRAFLVKMRST